MKRLLVSGVLVTLVIFTAIPCNAGKNAGGALIVHAADSMLPTNCYGISYHGLCGDDCYLDPGTCDNARHQSNYVDPNLLFAEVVWLIAAFPEGAYPGVSAITFGIEHNLGMGYLGVGEVCGPENSYETPDAGWPENWETAGNTVTLGEPVVGETLLHFYWVWIYGDAGNYFGTGINPTLGYTAFTSDDAPPVDDECTRFGQVRWFEPGFNDCPEPLVAGACCFEDGSCEMLFEYRCFEAGGIEWIADDACVPENPCTPTATAWSTWGKIKARCR